MKTLYQLMCIIQNTLKVNIQSWYSPEIMEQTMIIMWHILISCYSQILEQQNVIQEGRQWWRFRFIIKPSSITHSSSSIVTTRHVLQYSVYCAITTGACEKNIIGDRGRSCSNFNQWIQTSVTVMYYNKKHSNKAQQRQQEILLLFTSASQLLVLLCCGDRR